MLANYLTLSRIVLAGGFAAVVAAGSRELGPGTLTALLALAVAIELTDMFDGIVARRSGTAGPLGGLLDPLADSLSRLTVYFAMALAGWVTIAVPLVMAGRDIVVAYTRIFQAAGGGKTSARISGKIKAIVQGVGVFAILVLAGLPDRAISLDVLAAARAVTAGVIIVATVWSLLDYVRGARPAIKAVASRNDAAARNNAAARNDE